MKNSDIAGIMRETRKQRGLTQRDIANVLDKTPATVSDIERGKIQISASDLSKIADVLNKPIEYFFGESYESEEIQDLVVIIRKQSKETQQKIIEQTKMFVSLYSFQKIVNNKDRELSDQELNDAFNYLLRYSDEIGDIYKITLEFKKNVKDALKTQK